MPYSCVYYTGNNLNYLTAESKKVRHKSLPQDFDTSEEADIILTLLKETDVSKILLQIDIL